jgi:hypothetical protein
MTPELWQETFLRAPAGASVLALTARQRGKTTAAAWAIAHTMVFRPGSLSVIACPAQRQSAEAVRRVREALTMTDRELKSDNVYGLELTNGARVLALPGSDDSIRGMTVDGWIVADEAARLPADLIAALRPMRRAALRHGLRCCRRRGAAPIRSGRRGRTIPNWIKLQATAESAPFSPEFLASERRALGDHAFQREYYGIPMGAHASPFSWELFERATRSRAPLVRPGSAFEPRLEGRGTPVANPFQALKRAGGRS